MIGTVLKGTTRKPTTNRQLFKLIQNMSSNTCKIPAVTSKQPLKEGESNCYECRTYETSVSETGGQHIAVAREDDLEEIVETIEENLEEDAKEDASEEEESPLKEGENLNESSDEDEEMYLWDKVEYKTNYI